MIPRSELMRLGEYFEIMPRLLTVSDYKRLVDVMLSIRGLLSRWGSYYGFDVSGVLRDIDDAVNYLKSKDFIGFLVVLTRVYAGVFYIISISG
jgi:hypothetical protein